MLIQSTVQPIAIQYPGKAEKHAPFIGEDEFVPHLIKKLSLDNIEVRVDFLSIIVTMWKTHQSAGNQTRPVIFESASGQGQNSAIALFKSQL